MNAAPEYFMHEPPQRSEASDIDRREAANDDVPGDEQDLQRIWHWFAVGVLVFCWIAEASMCAMRGF